MAMEGARIVETARSRTVARELRPLESTASPIALRGRPPSISSARSGSQRRTAIATKSKSFRGATERAARPVWIARASVRVVTRSFSRRVSPESRGASSSATRVSRWSPWISMAPSFSAPPVPQQSLQVRRRGRALRRLVPAHAGHNGDTSCPCGDPSWSGRRGRCHRLPAPPPPPARWPRSARGHSVARHRQRGLGLRPQAGHIAAVLARVDESISAREDSRGVNLLAERPSHAA